MSKLPYGATEMLSVTSEMAVGDITCVVSGKGPEADHPAVDDFTERPEEQPTEGDLTELA